jgi:hypothetical protein
MSPSWIPKNYGANAINVFLAMPRLLYAAQR